MKIKLNLSLLLIIIANFIFAQATFLDKIEITPSLFSEIVANPDGSFLIANSFKDDLLITQLEGIQIIKYDECKSIVFTKKLKIPNLKLTLASFIRSSDGFYYLIGYLYDPANNLDFFFLKLNPDGSQNIFKIFGGPLSDIPYSIQETPEGNLMIFGNTRLASNENRNFYLVLDNQGNTLSSKAYFNAPIWGRAIACSDSGFLGRMGNIIYKVDKNGDLEWANFYSGTSYSSPFVEVEDGYLAVSFRDSETSETPHFLYKLKKNGDLEWVSKSYKAKGRPQLKVLENGNFLCLESYTDNPNSSDYQLSLIEFSPEGKQLSNQILTTTFDYSSTISKDFDLLPDGSIIFVSPSGNDRDTLLVGKTNSNFELGCEDQDNFNEGDFPEVTVEPRTTNVSEISFDTFELNLEIEDIDYTYTRICENIVTNFPEQNDTTICIGEEVVLDFLFSGATYQWEDGSNAATRLISQAGIYNVLIEKCGESVNRTVQVNVEDCSCNITIPNAFTPNKDQVNDQFGIISDCELLDFQLKIYNRWGQEVFKTNDYTSGWDGTFNGKNQPSDVYVFQYQFRWNKGTKQNLQVERGDVTLIR